MTPSAMTATQAGEFRAAGTDLSERRRSGMVLWKGCYPGARDIDIIRIC